MKDIVLWGFQIDGSAFSRFLRGLALAVLTNVIDQANAGREFDWHTAAITAGAFLVGWLRAGEPNKPKEVQE